MAVTLLLAILFGFLCNRSPQFPISILNIIIFKIPGNLSVHSTQHGVCCKHVARIHCLQQACSKHVTSIQRLKQAVPFVLAIVNELVQECSKSYVKEYSIQIVNIFALTSYTAKLLFHKSPIGTVTTL